MFVPFQAPLTAKAAEYCTDSNLFQFTEFKFKSRIMFVIDHKHDEDERTIYTVGPRHFFEGILT